MIRNNLHQVLFERHKNNISIALDNNTVFIDCEIISDKGAGVVNLISIKLDKYEILTEDEIIADEPGTTWTNDSLRQFTCDIEELLAKHGRDPYTCVYLVSQLEKDLENIGIDTKKELYL